MPAQFWDSVHGLMGQGWRYPQILDIEKQVLRELGISESEDAATVLQDPHFRTAERQAIITHQLLRISADSRLVKKLNSIHLFSVETVEEMLPENYARAAAILVIGDPLSTDIDLLVFTNESGHSNGATKPLFSSERKKIERWLIDLGYDVLRGIDMNVVFVEDGLIKASSKGGAETANIALATYHHHAQQLNNDQNTPLALELFPHIYAHCS